MIYHDITPDIPSVKQGETYSACDCESVGKNVGERQMNSLERVKCVFNAFKLLDTLTSLVLFLKKWHILTCSVS